VRVEIFTIMREHRESPQRHGTRGICLLSDLNVVLICTGSVGACRRYALARIVGCKLDKTPRIHANHDCIAKEIVRGVTGLYRSACKLVFENTGYLGFNWKRGVRRALMTR
jgi:hypothetical protein